MYRASFHEKWPGYFKTLDNAIQERIVKKIRKVLEYPEKRHLKGSANYFVDEVGQYRILYQVLEENQEVRFFFVGDHKTYEKWYRQYD